MALLMESEPDSDSPQAGPALVRLVHVFLGGLLKVLAPFRLVTAETGVTCSMPLQVSTCVAVPVVILVGTVFSTPVAEKTISLSTEKTQKCSILL